jgi:hypothetical protein
MAERILADSQAILSYSQSLNIQRNGRIVLALPPLFFGHHLAQCAYPVPPGISNGVGGF